MLDCLGVGSHFSVVVSDEDVVHKKPHPEMVLVACEKSGVQPANVLVIGDTVYDIEMGRRAGAWTCAVTWGNQTADQLATERPDFIVESVAALHDVITAAPWRG